MFRLLMLAIGLSTLLSCMSVTPSGLPHGVTWLESHQVKDGEIGIAFDKYQLANGLTILLHQDSSDPLVHVNVTYHVGSAREEPGMSGFAHFFEHMMFQGSVHAPDDLHTKLIDAMGGESNGGTTSDITRYYNTVPANELEKMLWLEADRMAFVLPMVTQEKFEIQRATVKNERAQNYENAPYGMVWETVNRAMFPPEHPYAWPTIGYVEDLNRVGLNELRQFFQRWYGPNNATLVIGGDFDKQQALAWAVKYFAAIPSGPSVESTAKQPVTLDSNRYVTLPDKIQLPLLQISFPTVYVHHEDEAPLDLLSQLIGEGKNSLLYQKLVKTGLAVRAGASHPCRELACSLNIYAMVNPASGTSLAQLEQVIRDSLQEWSEQDIAQEQLETFQRIFKAETLYGLENVSSKASQLANNEAFFGKPDTVAFDLKRYGAVTEKDIHRVYQRYLKDKGSVVLSVVPEGQSVAAAKLQNYVLPAPLLPAGVEQEETQLTALTELLDRSQMPATAESIVNQPPQLWDVRLDNGIAIKGITSQEVPINSIRIRLEGGILLEPIEKAGLANLTAQMMNEGSVHHSAEQLAEMLDSMGSTLRVAAGGRSTEIQLTSVSEFLPQTLDLLKEVLFEPAFNEQDFQRIKQRHLQLLQQAESDPNTIASRVSQQLLWGKTKRLGLPSSGSLETVSRIQLADVKAYYAQNYSAAMASVVVVGDLDATATQQRLAFLDAWQGQKIPLPDVHLPLSNPYQGKIILVDHPGATQSIMTVGRASVPFDATGQFFKIHLMNHPFGGTFSSRVNQLLREQRGYTYGAFSRFSGDQQSGEFQLSASIVQNQTAAAVRDTIALLADYSAQGPSLSEVDTMRAAVTQREALLYESTSQKAALLSQIQYYDLAPGYKAQQQALIETISQPELAELARQWLAPKNMWILIVADANQVEAELKQINGWPLVRWQLH